MTGKNKKVFAGLIMMTLLFSGCDVMKKLENPGAQPTPKKEEAANNTHLYASVVSLAAMVAEMGYYFVNKYNNKINKINWQTELAKRTQDPFKRKLITRQSHLQYTNGSYNPARHRELSFNYYAVAQKCPKGGICIATQPSHKLVNDNPKWEAPN
jgi:hypothetical protein